MSQIPELQNANNPIKQTLFRFTTLRNPQLTETKEKNLGFIHRPEQELIKGHFDNALANYSSTDGITKFSTLVTAAETFVISSTFKSERALENSLYSELLKLGKTISRKENIDNRLKRDAQQASERIDLIALREIWDNFIYQVVTQKDFYVKEGITQILKALHYLYAGTLEADDEMKKINGENLPEKALEAIVVLPAALFLDETENPEVIAQGIPFTVNKSEISEGRIKYASEQQLPMAEKNRLDYISSKEAELSIALLQKDSLETLKKELEKLEKNYHKAYTKAYNEQYEEYKAEYQPLIDAYETSLDQIETTFTEETTEAEKDAAYANLGSLDIPSFQFNFRSELDIEELRSKLSEESFALFLELFSSAEMIGELTMLEQANQTPLGIDDENMVLESSRLNSINTQVSLDEDYDSFQKVLNKIKEEYSSQYAKALSLKELPQNRFANIGGVLVPLKNDFKVFANTYRLFTSSRGVFSARSFLNFNFDVEDNGWSVSSAKFSIDTDRGSFTETFNNIAVANGTISFPAMFNDGFRFISSLKIEIWFANGCTSILEFGNVITDTNHNGMLNILKPSKNSSTETPSVFQPKHFGVKRMGIADYLKVEQSVHAYVPGEVSNIENVMASELRHKSSTAREYSEITETTSKSQETEKMSDTTKTSRTDIQTEVAKELDRQQSVEAHASFSAGGKKWKFEVGGSYANNTAQHDSTRQAVAKSQEITERAMERVLTKVSEERVEKIIKEYTETNVHEFDNRGKVTDTDNPDASRPQHITGVYRWVDKKMKNQIYNYGKRTMFEFMIPEPARLHALATKATKANLTEPLDPRKAPSPHTMIDANVDETILKHWAKIYGVILTNKLEGNIIQDIPRQNFDVNGNEGNFSFGIAVKENYTAVSAKIWYGFAPYRYRSGSRSNAIRISDFKGGELHIGTTDNGHDGVTEVSGISVKNNYEYGYRTQNVSTLNLRFALTCVLSNEYLLSWKQENFNAIITAYTQAKEKFDDDVKTANAASAEQEKENPEKKNNFYRITESNILKHNCIAYLLKSYGALGQKMSEDDGKTMQSFYMQFGEGLDQYTALAKFMEQAFEWSVMDYTFYPYYWANKERWDDLYLTEDLDPLFRSFLQAGMARVIVTVKPGFEDAVQFFMCTGRIWNGGAVPVIGDPMYLSIVDELREPTGVAQGKYWITRIPTTLTILQAKSVGLEVTEALPIFPESDPENCENPSELETVSAFSDNDAIMQSLPGTTSTLD